MRMQISSELVCKSRDGLDRDETQYEWRIVAVNNPLIYVLLVGTNFKEIMLIRGKYKKILEITSISSEKKSIQSNLQEFRVIWF